MDTGVERDLTALTGEFFRAVTFEPGARPGYDRIHDLFIEGGRLVKNSGPVPEVSTVDEFIAPRQRMVDAGELTAFEETETGHRTDVFGNIAHRLSTYEKRGVQDGVPFEGRGVISTQFIRTPAGWRMTAMAWDDERPGLSIPAGYPHSGAH
jgi:hypothetical protein